MEKIPTASDFLWNTILTMGDTEPYGRIPPDKVYEAMVRFAKLHVEAALKAASEKVTMQKENIDTNGNTIGVETFGLDEYQGYEGYNEDEIKVTVEKDSILNAYPLDKIT